MDRFSLSELMKLRHLARIAHHLPGRLRLKFSASALSELDVTASKQWLDNFPGITSYRLNPAALSLLIEYDTNLVQASCLDRLFSENQALADKAINELSELTQ